MIKSVVLGNIIHVRSLVCLVFVLLCIVPDYMDASGGFRDSKDPCQRCKEENFRLPSLFGNNEPESRRQGCLYVQKFLRCAEPLEMKCRPNLHFQSSLSSMRFNYEKECTNLNITSNEEDPRVIKKPGQKWNTNKEKQCQRPKLKPVYKVCGLFGDPHLRTFLDKRHTCSVPGAWPLFANRYLTVQVTNIPLENSSRATATSKVTVIVRGLKRKCIEEKTYQARSFSLPTTFSDGTKSSSDKDCPTTVTQLKKGRRIMINICILKTKIIIRQVGKYLTVHMRVPEDLTRRGKTLGLCQRGCPRLEQMNQDKMNRIDTVIASFYKKEKLTKRVKRQRQARAKRLCGAAKVTGFYYKSCLFDMLTSDDATFVKAARKAMKDFRAINKDDAGRPIVNETARDFWTGETTRSTLRTTDVGATLAPGSSAFTVHKSSFSLLLLTLILLLHVFR